MDAFKLSWLFFTVLRLADAKINVIAVDAVSVDERYGAWCWVAPRDVKKAATILGAV